MTTSHPRCRSCHEAVLVQVHNGTTVDGTTAWQCSYRGVHEEFFVAEAHRGPRPSLVDVLTHDKQASLADAKAVAAMSMHEWPGLSLAAVPYRGDRCLMLARGGGTKVASSISVEVTSVVGYVWMLVAHELRHLRSVGLDRWQRREPGLDAFHERASGFLGQAQCVDQVPASGCHVTLVLTDLGGSQEDLCLVHGRS
jgi:hypothetical protein